MGWLIAGGIFVLLFYDAVIDIIEELIKEIFNK